MRLKPGQPAPAFSVTDLHGNTVSLARYGGRHLLLSFYRFASCPFCNLRVHELILRQPELSLRGLSLVAVFQSPREGILEYVGRQRPPFPIVADPGQALYRQYGVESSLRALLAGATLHLGKAVRSMRLGFLPGPMDGATMRVPADFLIGPDGTILTTYYGRHVADHLPIEALIARLDAEAAGRVLTHAT